MTDAWLHPVVQNVPSAAWKSRGGFREANDHGWQQERFATEKGAEEQVGAHLHQGQIVQETKQALAQ